MREKQVPVDVVEMKGENRGKKVEVKNSSLMHPSSLPFPESIIAFAWEPNGSKFAVLHGESPRISVTFYHVKNNGKIDNLSE